MAGQGVGAKVRRWWWGVNNWEVPSGTEGVKANDVREVGSTMVLL